MAQKFKYTKQEIIDTAFDIIDQEGLDNLTARHLGEKMHSSSKIIFGSFNNMDHLKNETFKKIFLSFQNGMIAALNNRSKPGYISCGLYFLNFVNKHPHFFKIISKQEIKSHFKDESLELIYQTISKKSNVSYQDAINIHFRYWIYLNGMATMINNKMFVFEENQTEELLKEYYTLWVNFYHKKEME